MKRDSQFYQGLKNILFEEDGSPKLCLAEISSILTNTNLIERNSFHVIKDGVYENLDRSNDHMSEINRVKEAIESGQSVIVKDLEMWGGEITAACNYLGPQTTAHMYIAPPSSNSFPLHEDDTDVVVAMLYGQKIFYLEDPKVQRELVSGDFLEIKKGRLHCAEPQGWSCHISFGSPNGSYLNTSTYSYPVEIPSLKELEACLSGEPRSVIIRKVNTNSQ
jgi:hypothetical protein